MALPPCPASPNCVSSDAPSGGHHVAPLVFGPRVAEAWAALLELLADSPRVAIVAVSATTAHAVFTTRLLRFRDDVHLQLREAEGLIAIRSCSRVGHSDLGTNRRRVEALRTALTARLGA